MKYIEVTGKFQKVVHTGPTVFKFLFRDRVGDIYYMTLTKNFLDLRNKIEDDKELRIKAILKGYKKVRKHTLRYQNELGVLSIEEVKSNQ